MDWGTVPQWVTVGIAVTAGGIAIWNVISQRSVARRRAAFDLFLKTETDEKMITAYDNFHKAIAEMGRAASIQEFCTGDKSREHYLWIRKYLNVHELVAVGLKQRVLDVEVCYSYWGDTLMNGFKDAKPVLDYVRDRPKNRYTYSDLVALKDAWSARKTKAAS